MGTNTSYISQIQRKWIHTIIILKIPSNHMFMCFVNILSLQMIAMRRQETMSLLLVSVQRSRTVNSKCQKQWKLIDFSTAFFFFGNLNIQLPLSIKQYFSLFTRGARRNRHWQNVWCKIYLVKYIALVNGALVATFSVLSTLYFP